MLIAALVIGGLTAYYFGLRLGAYAAAGTALLCLVATFMPRYAVPIYVALAGAAVAVIVIGPRRKRPADAALAVRWVRGKIRGARAMFGGDEEEKKR
jgi:hypothetical protein